MCFELQAFGERAIQPYCVLSCHHSRASHAEFFLRITAGHLNESYRVAARQRSLMITIQVNQPLHCGAVSSEQRPEGDGCGF
jgi:hypothetical protein